MTKLSLDPESRIDTAAGAARSLRRNQCSDEERKCMKPTIEIYASGPVSGSEAAALKRLVEALTELGKPALIFSNFTCNQRQVDFLIVTEFRVAHLELKHFPGPIEGEDFGPWYSLHASGARGPRIPSEEGNPREQAKNTKYAISDSLEEFARGTGAGPLRKGEKYFRRFESAVCLFPRIHPDSSLTRGDFKARVWSFENCLDEMDASSLVNPWPLDLWRRFATEYLRLDQVPLEAAISTEVYEAVTRLEALRANQVASLQTHVQETIELGPELPNRRTSSDNRAERNWEDPARYSFRAQNRLSRLALSPAEMHALPGRFREVIALSDRSLLIVFCRRTGSNGRNLSCPYLVDTRRH
jgi:hypothetical protein